MRSLPFKTEAPFYVVRYRGMFPNSYPAIGTSILHKYMSRPQN